jgi:hypothetical protein
LRAQIAHAEKEAETTDRRLEHSRAALAEVKAAIDRLTQHVPHRGAAVVA